MTVDEFQKALQGAAPEGYRVTSSVTADSVGFRAFPPSNDTSKHPIAEPITRSVSELSRLKATDPELANDISVLFPAPAKKEPVKAQGNAKK